MAGMLSCDIVALSEVDVAAMKYPEGDLVRFFGGLLHHLSGLPIPLDLLVPERVERREGEEQLPHWGSPYGRIR